MLLSGRVRRPQESAVIQDVLGKHFKRKVDEALLYTVLENTSPTTRDVLMVKLYSLSVHEISFA